MKNKTVIYSALFGNIDNFHDAPYEIHGCDLIHFTDNPNLKSKYYEVRLLTRLSDDSRDLRRLARMVKVQPHLFIPEYEQSIWIDASASIINKDIEKWINETLKDKQFALFPHMHRTTIKQERDTIIERKKDNPFVVMQQYKKYIKDGFQDTFLAETGILLRRHMDPSMIQLANTWWSQINSYSLRDQLSLPYAVWKNPDALYTLMEGFVWDNDYIKINPHNESGTNLTNIQQKIDYRKEFLFYLDWARTYIT